MKKILLWMLALGTGILSLAQANNPYAARGEEYARAVNMIVDDFNAGLVKDFSDEAISSYAKRLPVTHQVSVELIVQVIEKMKAPGFDPLSYLEKISMPEPFKSLIRKLLFYLLNSTRTERKTGWYQLTEEIKKSPLSDTQMELLLTFVAIANSSEMIAPSVKGRKERQCYVSGPDGWGYASGEVCVVLGAVTGAWIGFELCGIWCMFGGAIVGGLIGGLS